MTKSVGVIIFAVFQLFWMHGFGQVDSLTRKIKIGVKESPPFVTKVSGKFEGLSIDLWEKISDKLNISYQFEENNLPGLLMGMEEKTIDFCVNPLTVTSNRLEFMSFTQPFFISDLGLAVPKQERSVLLLFFANIFSGEFLKAVTLLLLVIMVFGLLFWLVERRKNLEQLETGTTALFNSFWWSAVTMTTVGYGDKYPVTPLGKLIGIIWMFTSVIIISGFTASIASSLTVERLSYSIEDLNDLKNLRLGAVEGSSTEKFLKNSGLSYKAYSRPIEGLEEMKEGGLDVFVYDKPLLQYYLNSNDLGKDMELLPISIKKEFYGFSAPRGSSLIDRVNFELVKEIESGYWTKLKKKYQLEKY